MKEDFWGLIKKDTSITNLEHYYPGQQTATPYGVHIYNPPGISKDHPFYKWRGKREVGFDTGNKVWRFVSTTDLEAAVFAEPVENSKLLSIHKKYSYLSFITAYRRVLNRTPDKKKYGHYPQSLGCCLEALIVEMGYFKNQLAGLRTHTVNVNNKIASRIALKHPINGTKADLKAFTELEAKSKLKGLGIEFRLPTIRPKDSDLEGSDAEWDKILGF